MSSFTDKFLEGIILGNYICDECGSKMEFEDSMEDTLVCPNCGYSTDLDDYGRDEDDDYGEEVIYPEQTWSDEEDDITINLYDSEDDEEFDEDDE